MEATTHRISDRVPTVLVVSEDAGYTNLARRSLAKAGFDPVVTRSAFEALQLAAEGDVDALICDYDLSQGDGLDVWSRLVELHGDAAPPALMLGDHYSPVLLARCIAQGTAGLHAKSESFELLIDRVTALIRDEDKRAAVERVCARRQVLGGTDALTGLASSEHFNRRMIGESVAAYRDNAALSLLMIVPDRFPSVVERHGQRVADGLLAKISRLVEGELRSRDGIARYAEQTFAVVLPDTPLTAAKKVGDRLRTMLASIEFGDLDHPLSVSVSVGAACRPSGVVMSPEELCVDALNNCVVAQKMGGDRVYGTPGTSGKPVVVVFGAGPDGGSAELGLDAASVDTFEPDTSDDLMRILSEQPVGVLVGVDSPAGRAALMSVLTWVSRRYPETKRVLVSGTVDSELMTLAVNEATVDHFLAPPIDGSELTSAINELLFE